MFFSVLFECLWMTFAQSLWTLVLLSGDLMVVQERPREVPVNLRNWICFVFAACGMYVLPGLKQTLGPGLAPEHTHLPTEPLCFNRKTLYDQKIALKRSYSTTETSIPPSSCSCRTADPALMLPVCHSPDSGLIKWAPCYWSVPSSLESVESTWTQASASTFEHVLCTWVYCGQNCSWCTFGPALTHICRTFPRHPSTWTLFLNWHCKKTFAWTSFLHLVLWKVFFFVIHKLQQISLSLGRKCSSGIRILLQMYSTRLYGPWSENEIKQVRVCCCEKVLCAKECVWTALVAVLVSRELSLYIVYV